MYQTYLSEDEIHASEYVETRMMMCPFCGTEQEFVIFFHPGVTGFCKATCRACGEEINLGGL